jgi:hypothetical protein
MHPYLYKTTDYGRHWVSIARGIPADEIVRSVREDPTRPGLLYLGTERGVWVSFDDGLRWKKLQRNLPVTQVAARAVTDPDLVIATQGRSFWILDNIDVLRQLDATNDNKSVHLFRPAPAVRDVDPGIMIDYYLPKTPAKLTIDILDSTGKLVRSFQGSAEEPKKKEGEDADEDEGPKPAPKPGMKPGLNRYTWDMHYPGFTEFKGMIFWAARNRGPAALPGQYRVRLTVDGKSEVQPAEIRLDPRVGNVPMADLQKRFDLAMRIRDKVSQANDAVLLIRGVRAQLAERLAKASDPAVRASVTALDQQLAAIEGRISQVRIKARQDPLNYPIMLNTKLAALGGVVAEGESAPTDHDYAVFADQSQRLDARLGELDKLLATDLPRLNQQLAGAHLPPVERKAEAPVEPGTATAPGLGEEDDE